MLDIREDGARFGAFSILLFAVLAVTMRNTPFASLVLISLKLSLLVHLPGYLIALGTLREEYDPTALLFIGFGLGIILSALLAYAIGTLGFSITELTYAIPLMLLAAGAALHYKRRMPTGKE